MRPFPFTAWAVPLLAISIAGAQTIARKEPAQYAVTERAPRVEATPPGLRLGLRKPREFALAPWSGTELARLSEPGPRLKTGVHRALAADTLANGAWEVTPEGVRIWRMAIHSPGSTGLRVEFRNFSVGSGLVWIHDGSRVVGPYTGRGLFDDGSFWSGSLSGDSIAIEYQPASRASGESVLPFEIHTIALQARGSRAAATLRGGAAPLEAPRAGPADPADYCHLDPNCYPEWKPTMTSVAQITFEEKGAEYLCSGSLVATRNNSFKPYFLTAGHCIHSEDAARSMEVFWTYQTSACAAVPPASRQSSAKSSVGAHLIESATLEQGDYSLMLLKDLPNGVTFAGWDIGDPAQSTPLTGVHHPAGSWKRISFGERVGDQTYLVQDNLAPGNEYLQVLWDKGRTEPGSSGSPLFSSPGVIVGTLSYGPFSPDFSACQINPSVDGYARFSNTYSHLKDFFEDLPSAVVTPEKTGITFSVANHDAPPAQTFRLTTQSVSPVAFKLRADASWLQVSPATGTLSASSPTQITVTVDASAFDQPQPYSTTISVLSGTAPPLFVSVVSNVTVDQSNVAASISQLQRSGTQWSFTIRLQETGGAATRVTSAKVNGTDYSASIKSWFGTDRIPARGAIEAPLEGTGVFPAGTQYFEFAGIDDSGQHWYRVATVNFQ